MFNSVSFNVVLGLILVYLLYSLLGTILSEFVATILKLRPKMLRHSINRMLTDGSGPIRKPSLHKEFKHRYHVKPNPKIQKIKDKIANGEDKRSLKHRYAHYVQTIKHADRHSFAGRFFEYPSIKYLSKRNTAKGWRPLRSSQPSYVSKELFASTIVSMMSEKGEGKTTIQKLEYCIRYNTLQIEYNTRNQLRSMISASQSDTKVFETNLQSWYAETMSRANGWYKRRVKLILMLLGLLVACIFNVDSIQVATTLSKDKETSALLAGLSSRIAHDSSIRKLVTEPGGDSILADTRFDSNYSQLAQDIRAANHLLGLGWDADEHTYSFEDTFAKGKNIDSAKWVALSKKFENYQKIQRHLFRAKDSLAADHFRIIQNQQQYRIDLRNGALRRADQNKKGDQKNKPDKNGNIPKGKEDATIIDGQADKANNLLYSTILDLDSVDYLKTRDSAFTSSASIDSVLGISRVYITSADRGKNIFHIIGQKYLSPVEKIIYVLFTHPWSISMIIGFLITAIAISLGAPFWFNLLVKLASLRNTGEKPEDKKYGFPDPAALPLNLKDATLSDQSAAGGPFDEEEDPVQAAIALIEEQLATMPGFIRVTLGWKRTMLPGVVIPDKTSAIEIQVADPKAEEAAKAILQHIKINYLVVFAYNSLAVAHAQIPRCGNSVYNTYTSTEIGTLGCFAAKQGDSGIYLLSCWHVIKGDTDYKNKTITWSQVQVYESMAALLTDGCLTDKIDVGFARLVDPSGVQNTFGQDFRAVTPADAKNSTKVSFKGTSSQEKEGYVDSDSTSVKLQYPGGGWYTLNDIIRICSYDAKGGPSTISTGGDSGAVVIDKNADSPVGLIVGGDDQYTYVVKFSNFLDPESGMFKEYSLNI
jgi:hypothetical protein